MMTLTQLHSFSLFLDCFGFYLCVFVHLYTINNKQGIVACNAVPPHVDYDWYQDHAIWSNGEDAETGIKNNRWHLMLVDFGFARALENKEIEEPASGKHMRNSIVFEKTKPLVLDENDDDDDLENSEDLDRLVALAAGSMRVSVQAAGKGLRRLSGVSMPIIETDEDLTESALETTATTTTSTTGTTASSSNNNNSNTMSNDMKQMRKSKARHRVRAMSALGTKAYAAPEIRKKLRQKTTGDVEKSNAAMTECVADYGMIVDAFSVGWTLRVAITGVPPNFTISEYMRERDNVIMENDTEVAMAVDKGGGCCCLFRPPTPEYVRIRDPDLIPKEATLLITAMTEKDPEKRMTVREAQNQPYVRGKPGEIAYKWPIADIPYEHGDRVVPLSCAAQLNTLTANYHAHEEIE
jgi:serine/threonine protein kinase